MEFYYKITNTQGRNGFSANVIGEPGRGFSLLELLIVIVLIAIVMSIALSLVLRSKGAANEASAIMSMRVILTAQSQFRLANQRYGDLAELGGQGYLNVELTRGEKAGYLFQANLIDEGIWQWYAEGIPKEYRVSGVNAFYADERETIRAKDTGMSQFVPREESENWPVLGE